MGQKQSRNQGLLGQGGGYHRDDGCIGNRKVRTITLSLFLIVFYVLGLGFFFKNHDVYNDPNAGTRIICEVGDDAGCTSTTNALLFIVIGAFVAIASAICAILLFFIDCDDTVGRIAGVGLLVGGGFYIVGWTWYIRQYAQLVHLSNETLWPKDSDARNQMNAQLACWFGEALLPAGTSILLGVDVFMHLFDKESHRLATNLAILFVVSGMCSVTYYNNSGISDDESIPDGLQNSDSFAYIASGYAIICLTSLLYVILYIFTCCTCDCKDTACARLIHALGLIIGGILASIGYYMYAGDLKGPEDTPFEDVNKEMVWYFIGYTVLIGGACFTWALDIGLDDVKSN